jgi:hypothetical protein
LTGSKSKASEGASQSVPCAVSSSSSSSSLSTDSDSDTDNYEYYLFANHELRVASDYGDSDDSDGGIGVFQATDEGKKIAAIGEPACHLLSICLCVFSLPKLGLTSCLQLTVCHIMG